MNNKEMISHMIPVIQGTVSEQAVGKGKPPQPAALKKFLRWFKGDKTNAFAPDKAAELIAQIEDAEVARIVSDLHYKTPQSLKAMRMTCQECFMLPDDCPYYDYSIFDVKKAVKRLAVQPKDTHGRVIAELQKINNELAYHLHEYLE